MQWILNIRKFWVLNNFGPLPCISTESVQQHRGVRSHASTSLPRSHRRSRVGLHQRQLHRRLPQPGRLHCHAGSLGGNMCTLLANVLGTERRHHRYVDSTGGEWKGRDILTPPSLYCVFCNSYLKQYARSIDFLLEPCWYAKTIMYTNVLLLLFKKKISSFFYRLSATSIGLIRGPYSLEEWPSHKPTRRCCPNTRYEHSVCWMTTTLTKRGLFATFSSSLGRITALHMPTNCLLSYAESIKVPHDYL